MAWQQFEYPFEKCLFTVDIPERQKLRQQLLSKHLGNLSDAQKCLYFRGKIEVFACLHIIEWLFSNAIAGEHQFPFAPVPQGNGKHPIKSVHERFTELFVEVDNDFGVGLRAEDMILSDQFLAQVPIVVDLAVKDYHDRSILI